MNFVRYCKCFLLSILLSNRATNLARGCDKHLCRGCNVNATRSMSTCIYTIMMYLDMYIYIYTHAHPLLPTRISLFLLFSSSTFHTSQLFYFFLLGCPLCGIDVCNTLTRSKKGMNNRKPRAQRVIKRSKSSTDISKNKKEFHRSSTITTRNFQKREFTNKDKEQ